jgi:hypothetical protein
VHYRYDAAVAALADALNDAKRSLIGDAREGVYKVAFKTNTGKEAIEVARQLARIGIVPRTTIEHDNFGNPIAFYVTVWSNTDQKAMLELTNARLQPRRRDQLNDLVLARGPVPDDVLERIWNAAQRGMSPARSSEKLNELGIIAGMGGKRWTATKVRNALAEHERRQEQHQEAA